MKYEEIIIPSADGYSLSARIFNCENPKAVIKCIHGMEEHQDRYVPFADFLAKNGYVVVTSDMRGHGVNAPTLSHIADKKGDKLLMEDEDAIRQYISEHFPKLPKYLFGHSMGTIIARRVLQEHSKDYDKVVLSGYPNPQGVASLGIGVSAIIGLFKKRSGKSKMLDGMVTGPFAKAVENRKTDLDWLSYNEENVTKYIEDPLCGVPFTIGSYNALFHLISDIHNPKKYKNVKENLPMYLISGMDDPCTGGEKGRELSISILQKAGFNNLEVKTLEGMRHEILNETNKKEVYQLILDFLNK